MQNGKFQLGTATTGTFTYQGQSITASEQPVSVEVRNTGGVDHRTTTSETIGLADQGKVVILDNATAISATLDSTVPNTFTCRVLVIGGGVGLLVPSSGQIQQMSSFPVPNGFGVDLSFDGTNWWVDPGLSSPGADANAKYVLGATDATIPNAVVNPTAYYGVDVQPASPTAFDDEFNAGSLAAQWSWANQGTGTISFANSSIIMTTSSSGGLYNLHLIVEAVPGATPYTFTAKLWMEPENIVDVGGICLYDGTKIGAIEYVTAISPPASSFAGQIRQSNYATVTSAPTINLNTTNYAPSAPVFFQITNDGTHLTYRYSYSGLPGTFRQIWQETTGAFLGTITKVGLFFYGYNGIPLFASDWFRRTA